MDNLLFTTSRKYAYSDDLALLHTSRDWKGLEETLSFDGYWAIYVPQLLIVMPLLCNNHFSEVHYFPIVTNNYGIVLNVIN